jgi:hypothetical protein
MGFICVTFPVNTGLIYTNIYVSLFSFSLFKKKDNWKCRMILQAHRSPEEKKAGLQDIFLNSQHQVNEFNYDISHNIYDKCYEYAKLMFGPPSNIIDEINGIIQWPVQPLPIVTIDLSGNTDLSGNSHYVG